jgi:hypothetical protein
MYVAMFDEVDEGTAIFKIAPTHSTTPQGASLVTLDAEGYELPSDWYLQVSRHMSGVLKGGTISLPRNFTLRAGETKQGVGAKLVYQTDGNLAVYDPVGKTLWAASSQSPEVIRSCASGCKMVFQGDGNLVLYDNGTPYWATATSDAQLGGTNIVTQLVLSYQSPFLLLKNHAGSNHWTAAAGLTWQSNQDSIAPSVSFNSPLANAVFITPQSVTISLTAMDNTGLSKLELRRNGSLAKTFTALPYTYTWPVTASLNGAHTWTATATDMAGLATTASLNCTVNIDLTAPTVPSGLVLVGKDQALSLAWNPSTDTGGSGVKLYQVSVSTSASFATCISGWCDKDVGNLTSASVSGLPPNTAYYARVRAQDNVGNMSAYSPIKLAKTLPDTMAPTVPTMTGVIEGFSLALSWTPSTDSGGSGLARYEVDVSTHSNFSSLINPWQNRDVGLAISTTVANVTFGQTYYARVRAIDGAGNKSQSVPVSVLANRIKNPGFEDFTSDASLPNQWSKTASAGTASGLLRSAQTGDFNSGTAGLKIAVIPSVTQVAYQPWTSYQPNKTYRLSFWGKVISSTDTMTGYADVISRYANGSYKGLLGGVRFSLPEWTHYSVTFTTDTVPERPMEVRASHVRSDLDGTIHFDDFSIEEIDRPTAPPSLPGPLTITPKQGSLSVAWGPSNGTPVDYYRMFISTRSDFAVHVPGWNNQNVGDRTSVHVVGVNEKTTYYVRLRAFNAVGGHSGYTPTVSATTLGDVTPPAAPPSLTATWMGGGRARLAWEASVDNVGVTQYTLERCVGTGCSNFVQIATLPVVGTVTGVDTVMFPDRVTLLWTGRTQFKNVTQNQKISVQGSTYTLNGDSGVGNLYIIKSAAVTVGDRLAFLATIPHPPQNILPPGAQDRGQCRSEHTGRHCPHHLFGGSRTRGTCHGKSATPLFSQLTNISTIPPARAMPTLSCRLPSLSWTDPPPPRPQP